MTFQDLAVILSRFPQDLAMTLPLQSISGHFSKRVSQVCFEYS